jgi:ATP-dependent Clp protease ATP-binding subunit ClpA
VSDAARRWFAREGYSAEFGARNISRLIQEKIKDFGSSLKRVDSRRKEEFSITL